jgi:hypothetical protein
MLSKRCPFWMNPSSLFEIILPMICFNLLATIFVIILYAELQRETG